MISTNSHNHTATTTTISNLWMPSKKSIMQKNHLTRESARTNEITLDERKKWIRHRLYSLVWYFDFLISFVLIFVVSRTFGSIIFFFAVRFIICCSCVCRRRYSFICCIYCSSLLISILLLLFFVLFSVHFLWLAFFCYWFIWSWYSARSLHYKSNTINYYTLLLYRVRVFFCFFLEANFKFSLRCAACIENIHRDAYRIRFCRYGHFFRTQFLFNFAF